MSLKSRIDIAGKKFNMLTVIEYSHTKNKKAFWLCKCECGNDKKISGAELRKGQKSCGCLVSKFPRDLSGLTFGRWTVEKEAAKDKHGKRRFICKCKCGNKKSIDGSSLRLGKSSSCGCLHKEILNDKKYTNNKKCKINKCYKKHSAKGFCAKHYADVFHERMDERGNYREGYQSRIKGRKCRYPECDRVGKKKDGLKRGLCHKHRRWATKGIIDLETCEILDPDRIPKGRAYIHCKMPRCLKKHRRNGFCEGHSSSYQAGVIDKEGNRIAKRAWYNYNDVKCKVRTCMKIMDGSCRANRLVKGFCSYHYGLHTKGYFNEFGMPIKAIDFVTKAERIKAFIKWSKENGKERAIKITWEGLTKTIKTWSRITKINKGTIKSRYRAGMPPELIFKKGSVRGTEEHREWRKQLTPEEPHVEEL